MVEKIFLHQNEFEVVEQMSRTQRQAQSEQVSLLCLAKRAGDKATAQVRSEVESTIAPR